MRSGDWPCLLTELTLKFRAEMVSKPVRDAAGQIDIQGTMQAVTSVIEGWIREYPDQWLWLHRRRR